MKTSLKDISIVTTGNSAPLKEHLSNSGTPFIRASSLEFLVRNESIEKCEKVGEIQAKNYNLKLFPKDTILFAKSGMSSKMGRIYQLEQPAYVVSHLAAIIPNTNLVSPSFLKFFFIKNPPFNLIKDDAYPSIKISDIEKIEIDLPDIETQNKIAEILNVALSLVEKRERTILYLDKLLESHFLEAFQKDLLNIKKKKKPLSDIATIVSGFTLGRKTKETNFVLSPYLRVANAQDGYFDLNGVKETEVTLVEKEKYNILKRDLLITEGGDPDKLGRGAIWEGEEGKFIYQNHLYRIRLKDPKKFSAYWLIYLIGSQFGKKYFHSRAKQTTGIASINKRDVSNFPVPTSTFVLQKKFEERYLRIKRSQAKLYSEQTELNDLFNSIIQRAFTGKLNFNISVELDALLGEIDPVKLKNDLIPIITNEEYLFNLIDRLNNQNFKTQILYEKAKSAVFQLLKENERVELKFIPGSNDVKLAVK